MTMQQRGNGQLNTMRRRSGRPGTLICVSLLFLSLVCAEHEDWRVEQAAELLESAGLTGLCHPTSNQFSPAFPQCDEFESRRTEELVGRQKDDWCYIKNGLLAATCVVIAALAAGLTMGLLSIDPLLLHIKMRAASTEEEKFQAASLLPIVKKHHLLLVTLLLLNSMANEALPLFLDALVPSYVAVILSVTLVLFFGEIIPSAVFTGPNRLAMASRLAPVVRIVMILLFPLAYPIAKLLDYYLHDEDEVEGSLYNRGELSALVRIQYEERLANKQHRKKERTEAARRSEDSEKSDRQLSIHVDEVSMVEGALTMSTKKAVEVYTPINQVFAIPHDMILNQRNLVKIYSSGNSRVPVYERNSKKPKDITAFRGILMSKQLMVVDTADQRRVSTLPLYQPTCVSPKSNLVDLINIFQRGGIGSKGGHMALVCTRPDIATASLDEGEAIPRAAGLMGIITLEDVIEELLQEEIYDETDKMEREAARLAKWASQKWKLFVKRKHEAALRESHSTRLVDVVGAAMVAMEEDELHLEGEALLSRGDGSMDSSNDGPLTYGTAGGL